MEEKIINLEGISPEALEAKETESKAEAAEQAPAEAAAPQEAPAVEETPDAQESPEIAPETAENEAAAGEGDEAPIEEERPEEPAENEPKEEHEDVPAEPVVAADAGELEREADGEKAAKENRKAAEKKPGKAAKSADAVKRSPARKPREIAEVGTKSNEIEEAESLIKSDKERLDDEYRALVRARRNGEYLMGEVFGVEPESEAFKNHAVVDVLYNGITIMIPDMVYFEDTYNFGRSYDDLPERKKTAARAVAARFQAGAKVYFTVSAVERQDVVLPDGNHHTVIMAVGDRKDAMARVRDTYFFHRNRSSETRAPRVVSVGDIAKAHVIAVREDMALVECLGVETRIDAFNLSNQPIENCRDYVHPGDTIDVRIRKLHVDRDDENPHNDRVFLTVSGRLNDATEALMTMKPHCYVAGVVDFYNRDKDLYTIMLKNGVTAVVKAQDVRGQIDLNPGDRVNVFVTTILNTHVLGMAAKA